MSKISTLLVSDASSEINSRIEKLIRSHSELNFEGLINKQLAPENIKGKTSLLVWYELDTNTELSITALQRLVASNPSCYFIVSKSSLDPELVKICMKIGVLDFLDYERAEVQLKSVIRRISALHQAEDRAANPGTSAAVEKRSQLKTSENLMQTGKWADFDFKQLQEGAAAADRLTEATRSPAPVPAAPPPPPSPAPSPPPPPPPPVPAAPTSKWGDLDNIGAPAAKAPQDFTNTTDDSFALPSTPAPASSAADTSGGGNKWGDLDSIPTPAATSGSSSQAASSPAPAAPQPRGLGGSSLGMKSSDSLPKSGQNKWGDLDSIGAAGGAAKSSIGGSVGSSPKQPQIDPAVLAPTPPPTRPLPKSSDDISSVDEAEAEAGLNPYAQLDEIGTGNSKWGDLDSIGAPASGAGNNPYAQLDEVETGKSKWGDLDAIGAPASFDSHSNSNANAYAQLDDTGTGKGKWGDLDAIGTPQAQKASQIDPLVTQPTPPGAKGKWGDLDAIGSPAQKSMPAPSEPRGTSGSKWGDLDSIGTPSSSAAPAPSPSPQPKAAGGSIQLGGGGAGGGGKWGDLDAITTPDLSNADAGGMEAPGAAGGSKWGNLDSIPTPKKSSPQPAPIAMPQSEDAPARGPIAMSGPRAAESRSASKRWGGEQSEPAGKMSSLREGKSAQISLKVGWEVWRVIIALGLTASAVFLSYKFFIY